MWFVKTSGISPTVSVRILCERKYLYGVGAQNEMFRLADAEGHKVCMVLQAYGTRNFTSFQNYNEFLDYYLSFRGQRCFYSIDRSYTVDSENSLLHLDIEWYSEKPDETYSSRIAIICSAVKASLPSSNGVQVLHDDLSRWSEPNT